MSSTNYMDNFLDWLESTTPEERLAEGRGVDDTGVRPCPRPPRTTDRKAGGLDMTATDVGTRLAAARKERHWSLRAAERRSGVPNAHISQIETGAIAHPGVPVLIRLATAYEIPLAGLLALAGHATFGTLDEHGRLAGASGHDLWLISAWLPKGREAEVAEWLAAHGIEVYRMWQPTADSRPT